jgi:hypothetical protein
MKSRWWIAASFLAALLLAQPGCSQGELPMESSAAEAADDPAMDTEMEMPK